MWQELSFRTPDPLSAFRGGSGNETIWECGGVGVECVNVRRLECGRYWNIFYQKSDVFKCMSYWDLYIPVHPHKHTCTHTTQIPSNASLQTHTQTNICMHLLTCTHTHSALRDWKPSMEWTVRSGCSDPWRTWREWTTRPLLPAFPWVSVAIHTRYTTLDRWMVVASHHR